MNRIRIIRRTPAIILLLAGAVFLLTHCIGKADSGSASRVDSSYSRYAGSSKCASCHRDIYEKHLHTEHYRTSAPASDSTVIGPFSEPYNEFPFDPVTAIYMEKSDTGLYQVEYQRGKPVRKGRFDIVIGSGRKGQSYLSWNQDRLVQLPITYFTPAAQWSNSPGYYSDRPMFYRPITSRCLECHSTYFEKTSDTSQKLESFDRSRIVYAVDCEKCHGPGASHVDFHLKNPGKKEGQFIVNPGKLPRERLLDLCTLCHGGQLNKTKPSFSFQAGDTLSNYFTFPPPDPNINNIDVHGNQMGLLTSSKCFTLGKVTCLNCHNTHENEKDQVALFSQRCQSCHSAGHEKTCGLSASNGSIIAKNCLDCHMPKQPSHAIAVYLRHENDPTPAQLRTHYITIYPELTEQVLAMLRKAKPEGDKKTK